MSTTLYVGNLPYSVTERQLEDLFRGIGTVNSVRIITDASGRSKGFGFVEMDSEEEARTAIERLNGYSLSNRIIVVNVARPRERGMRRRF